MFGAEQQQRRERHADVKGVALLEAERTRRQLEHVLEEEEAADRGAPMTATIAAAESGGSLRAAPK